MFERDTMQRWQMPDGIGFSMSRAGIVLFREQNRTEQNRTEQNRTEQNRTEQNRIVQPVLA